MAAQWPLVAAHLVALLPTLSGWDSVQVFNGAAVDVQKSFFATVGHSTDGNTVASGSYTWALYGDGSQYAEQGSVTCQLATRSPGDLAKIRAAMFDLLNEIEAAIRADRRLAVLSQEGYCGLTVDPSSVLATGNNSYASITFSVDYFTVT